MIKTGLLFGSFNPVHIGHIAIAGYMKEFEDMGDIWLVISPQNPFKNSGILVSPAARLEMVRLAVRNLEGFMASDIEFDMPKPSYTADTVARLNELHPDRDFHLIIGSDNVNSIGKWKNGRTLLRDCKFLIYPRPGTSTVRLSHFADARVVKAPVIEVSSSFIRKSIREGRNMKAFVPPEAYAYIEKNGFYRE